MGVWFMAEWILSTRHKPSTTYFGLTVQKYIEKFSVSYT